MPVESSIEPPTQPASAARAIAFAAVFGSSAPQFSRSALTGRSVASAIIRQFSMMASRLTVALPSVLARPRLVVASASNPIAASNFAVPASHGLGMMKAPGRACSARNASAFSIWVRIGNLRLVCWPVRVDAKLAGYLPSAKFVISLCIISFLHGRKHGQRCASHLSDRSPPRRHFERGEGAAPFAAGDLAAYCAAGTGTRRAAVRADRGPHDA